MQEAQVDASPGLERYAVPTVSITAAAFSPYGEVLAAGEDGSPASDSELALDLSGGAPRFYVMRLSHRPVSFTRITRHHRVTQCLASVGGGSWLVAVAAPDGGRAEDSPALESLVGFEVPGDVIVLLRRGTWHAGPFFTAPSMSFFNLELSDTNQVDHDTSHLDRRFGVECWFDRGERT